MNNDKLEIYKILINIGCCKRCSLRYTGDDFLGFDNPDSYLIQYGFIQEQPDELVQISKKIKKNSCVLCLGALEDSLIDEMVKSESLNDMSSYDTDNFICYISVPTSVYIREHSVELFIKEKFPDFYRVNNILPLNKAWTYTIQPRLAKVLNKNYNKSSGLGVKFVTSYDFDNEESAVMYKLERTASKSIKNLSRNSVVELLKDIDQEAFQKYIAIPPTPSLKSLTLSSVSYQHEPVFFGGRYCKYSRKLGQTPWIIDQIRVCESSVQEIVFEALKPYMNCRELIFSASGREDYDVRTLGRGRPFFVKLCDPKITKISYEQLRQVERTVNSSDLLSIQDLQLIEKKDLSNIKQGEEEKQKSYRTLCIIDRPELLDQYIEVINKLTTVVLEQKTPIRVYHRRAPVVRQKEIYSLKARRVEGRDDVFELDMITQAGTYIKEFIHGDLGRTKPSLRTIIGGAVDILALDVLDIDLDFPPPVKYN